MNTTITSETVLPAMPVRSSSLSWVERKLTTNTKKKKGTAVLARCPKGCTVDVKRRAGTTVVVVKRPVGTPMLRVALSRRTPAWTVETLEAGGEGWKHAEHGTVELSAIPATLEREAQTLRAAGFAQFDADDDEEEDEDEDEDEEEESKTKKRPREEEEDERKKTKKLRPVLSLSLSPQTDEQTNKSPTSERG
jgi:hypothetical protein